MKRETVNPKPADVVIVWESSIIYKSIEWWTKGPSYAMLVWENWPDVLTASMSELIVRKIHQEELDHAVILTWDGEMIPPPLSDIERQGIINILSPFIGTKCPNWPSAVFGRDQRIAGEFFCSQSVDWGYLQMRRDIVRRKPPQLVSPSDIWGSLAFRVVYE